MTMSLSDIVEIQVSVESVALTLPGFGNTLLLSPGASFAERVRTYSSLTDVVADFAATTPEYQAAAAMFGQSPHAPRVKIGRCANKPTQVFTIGVVLVADSTAYAVNVKVGSTVTAVSITSDASATNDEIVASLVAALNLVADNNYTAAATGTSGSQVVTVTADAAGAFFGLQVVDLPRLELTDTTAGVSLSADLDAIAFEDPDFYFVVPMQHNSKANLELIADWTATNDRCGIAVTADSIVATAVAAVSTDIAVTLNGESQRNMALIYRKASYSNVAAGIASIMGAYKPGAATAMWKNVVGETADNLSSTQRQNLDVKKASYYETIGGLSVLINGFVSDGWYIDVVRNLAWLKQTTAADIVTLLASQPKLPYTIKGGTAVEGAIRATFARAAAMNVISADYTVTIPDISAISSGTKATRVLPDVAWSAQLLQAIHKVKPVLGKVTF